MMWYTLVLLLLLLLCSVVDCQINNPNMPMIDIRFRDKRIECSMVQDVDYIYSNTDCTTFLYINDKREEYSKGKKLSVKWKKLVRVTAKCYGSCENNNYKNKNMMSKDLVINTEIFIGLCAAGAGVFLIIVALCVFWWCKWGRRFNCAKCAWYKEIEFTDVEKEKPDPAPASHLEKSTEKVKPNDYVAELKERRGPKKVSSSSEEDNLQIDTSAPNPPAYNADYSANFNYKEMTSDI